MEPLVLPQRDEDAEFSSQLMSLLNSPRGVCNGLTNLFSPDLNAGSGYELAPNGSLGSPDFTRQLNSAGLPGFSTNQHPQPQQHQAVLPNLQLPPLWPGGWQADSWPHLQSPTCPVLSPLGALHNGSFFAPDANGNGFYLEQQGILPGDVPELQLQPTHSMRPADAAAPTAAAAAAAGAAAAALAQVYPPVTPHQLQLPQVAVKQEEHHKPRRQQQQQQQRQVHLPPGVWLVAPTAHELVAPVVVQQQQQQQQQGPGGACGTAVNNAVMRQQHAAPAAQQQGRKRQLRVSADAGHKAARTSSSSSPSASASAAGTAAAAHPQQLGTIPEAGGPASLASLGAPRTPAAAAGRAGPAAASARGAGQLGIGSLVWGKVSRFPWWPAVVVPPPAADQPAPTGTDAGQGSSRPSLFVRFLGTHDTAWLDPRQVSAWPVQLGDRSSKTKAAAFVNALKEGRAYAATGALPEAFIDELPVAVQRWQQQQQQQQQQGDSHAPTTSAGSSRGTTAGSSRSRSASQEPTLHSSSSALAHNTPAPVALVAGAFAGVQTGTGAGQGSPGGSAGQPATAKRTGTQQRKAAAGRVERVATRSVQGGGGVVRQTRSGRQLRG